MIGKQQDKTAQKPSVINAENIWLVCIVAISIIMFLFIYSHIKNAAGNFDSELFYPYTSTNQLAALNPRPKDQFRENGRFIYTTACAPCHQIDGNGVAGQYPPLAGSEWVQANGAGRLIRIMLNGMQGEITVAGSKYNNTMVPWKDLLSDSQIAAVLTFIRSEWGNKAGAVSPENVKFVREKTTDRAEQWTAEELLQIQEFE